MPRAINWTPQQEYVFEKCSSGEGSFVVKAVAGSGKTVTLVNGASLLVGSVLAVAFNVRIKKELEKRMGSFASCKTMNGVGHHAMIKLIKRRPIIDANKVRKIGDGIFGRPQYKHLWESQAPTQQLVSRAKAHGLVPKGAPGLSKGILEDTRENWEELAIHYDLDFSPEILELAREILLISIQQSFNKGYCDFDDQIFLSACWGAAFDKFDNVLVDEAQDLSPIQHILLRKSLKPGGRLMAVGDPNQAIYGWRGATNDSISQLVETFDMEELDLTVSFRCPKAVVAEAQQIVPRIEAAEEAIEGTVTRMQAYDWSTFHEGDVVLCRNNAPLIKLAFRLIKHQVGAHVVGRDIGVGLKALVKRLMGRNYKDASVTDLIDRLETWASNEIEIATIAKHFGKAESVTNKHESLLAVIDGTGAQHVDEVIAAIDDLFGRDSAPTTLSTIHKAKGLEWDRVFFLEPELIPSIWSRRAFARDPDTYQWMMTEEENIRYVGVTRALQDLVYLPKEGWVDTESPPRPRRDPSVPLGGDEIDDMLDKFLAGKEL